MDLKDAKDKSDKADALAASILDQNAEHDPEILALALATAAAKVTVRVVNSKGGPADFRAYKLDQQTRVLSMIVAVTSAMEMLKVERG